MEGVGKWMDVKCAVVMVGCKVHCAFAAVDAVRSAAIVNALFMVYVIGTKQI